jgi:molecular chaperone GrpE (heat shock protein)
VRKAPFRKRGNDRRQLADTLASFGLEELEAEGQAVRSAVHGAVMQVEKAEGQIQTALPESAERLKLNGR